MVRLPGEAAMLAAQSSPVSGFVFVVAVLATSIVLAGWSQPARSRAADR